MWCSTNDNDQRLERAFSIDLRLWREKFRPMRPVIFDPQSITNFTSFDYQLDKFNCIMTNAHSKETFVYGPTLCEWLGLKHRNGQPQLIKDIQNKNVKQIDYGCNYFIILLDDGQVFLAGEDKLWKTDGKLKCISGQNDERWRFKQISCGYLHLLLLTTDHKLMAMGWNHYGQITGKGNSFKSMRDTNLMNVSKMACGWSHSLALTMDGEVFAWGDNDYGQLGLGDQHQRNRPTMVTFFVDQFNNHQQQVKEVFCAFGANSLFLMNDGTLYGCGLNPNGELETKPDELRLTPIKLLIKELVRALVIAKNDSYYDFGVIVLTHNDSFHMWSKFARKFKIFKPIEIQPSAKSFAEVAKRMLGRPISFGWQRTLNFSGEKSINQSENNVGNDNNS